MTSSTPSSTHDARSTQVQLVARPTGWPTPSDFRTVVVDLPELGAGQVRVVNDYLSVDPYMRGRMNDVASYVPPFALGETMTGGAVGRVVASTSDTHSVGDLVVHQLGWRDVAQGDAAGFRVVEPIPGTESSVFLGAAGMTAFTAWVGLTQIAHLAAGETVFVSGAAGAVGSMVGQIARQLGAARVIGSAGSDAKVSTLLERYGFDAAFNYKNGDVAGQLLTAAPDGINVYFDNVGGEHLEAAIGSMLPGGRAALCGAISQYNSTDVTPGPRNMSNLVTRGLTLRGFTVGGYGQHFPAFAADITRWLSSGSVVYDETVVTGIDHAVDALLAMMRGENTGKMVVKVS